MHPTPPIRLRALNRAPLNRGGRYVLYWMTAARRPGWSQGLARAVEMGRELGLPVMVLEALRAAYPFASDRLHVFCIEGMAHNRRAFRERGVFYYPYLEPRDGAGKGLLAALSRDAALAVTDAFPHFFLPRMARAAGKALTVRLEEVDSCGLLPLEAGEKAHQTAHAFRWFLQKRLPDHLRQPPPADPLEGYRGGEAVPDEAVLHRWPPLSEEDLARPRETAAGLPIDHAVPPVDKTHGGAGAAGELLMAFLENGLDRYHLDRNQPRPGVSSGLSAHLHWGHVSAWEIWDAVTRREGWRPERLGRPSGKREGWWGLPPGAEEFLDQLVTWRELSLNTARFLPAYESPASLPAWARSTLEDHAADRREYFYSLEELEGAATHGPLWNAAQTQLRREGVIAGYLRMLWGKKILEWSPDPAAALERMLYLNDRWSLDGRDPNSVSGVLWCLGRYDRPFRERPVFGKVRWMSSDSARKKLDLGDYLGLYGK